MTIGVPVRDGAALLPQALDSLLGQTFRDLEVVISDNASSDGTLEIARRYAEREPRVRVVANPIDIGGTGNFARVFREARGEYFKWAAHDDLCDPRFVERCVEVLDSDPTVVCCHARTRKIDARGEAVPGIPDPTRISAGGSAPRPHARFRDVLLNSGYGARSFGVIRASALRACRPMLPLYGSEKVLMAELALRGRYHDIDEELFFERVHPRAASALPSADAQQTFAAPSAGGGRFMPRLRLLSGYAGAVARAPIPLVEKALCGVALLAYVFQLRKWPRVAASVIEGTGTGGHQTAELAAAGAAGAACDR